LHQALENGVSKYPSLSGRFPQVSGIQFEFNPVNEPGSRIDAQRILIIGKNGTGKNGTVKRHKY